MQFMQIQKRLSQFAKPSQFYGPRGAFARRWCKLIRSSAWKRLILSSILAQYRPPAAAVFPGTTGLTTSKENVPLWHGLSEKETFVQPRGEEKLSSERDWNISQRARAERGELTDGGKLVFLVMLAVLGTLGAKCAWAVINWNYEWRSPMSTFISGRSKMSLFIPRHGNFTVTCGSTVPFI